MNLLKISVYFFLLPIIILIFSNSCSKPKDEISPVISFNLPANTSTFDIYDTIRIKASISDNENLDLIDISLTDHENTIIYHHQIQPVNQKTYDLDFDMVIDNNQLPQGIYYVSIIVSDGHNIIDSYKEITINELVPELKGLVVLTQNNSGVFNLHLFKNNSWNLISSFIDTINFCDISSAFNQVYVAGTGSTGFQAIDINSKEVAFRTDNQQHAAGKWFTGIEFQYPYIYVFMVDGMVRALDNGGNIRQSLACNPGTYANHLQYGDELLYISSIRNYPANYYISAHYKGNDLPFTTSPLTGIAAAIRQMDDNNMIIFTNTGNKGNIWTFNAQTSAPIKHKEMDVIIHDVSKIDANNFIIACDSSMYWYRFAENSLFKSLSTSYSSEFHSGYDPIYSQVYVGTEENIYLINYPELTAAGQITAPGKVKKILMYFNK